jgi:hypothetical protein
MSELYSVAVTRVAGPCVELLVTTVHPDAGPPPREPSFPLNLLVDLWSLLDRGYASLIGGVRLDDGEARALAAREPWGPALRGLRDLSHGVQVGIGEAEYRALQLGSSHTWNGQPLAGWGMTNGAYHVHLRGDEAAFREVAGVVISRYTQDRLEHQEGYRSWPHDRDGARPRARLAVELHDAALLGFVRRGMSFDTAAYF